MPALRTVKTLYLCNKFVCPLIKLEITDGAMETETEIELDISGR